VRTVKLDVLNVAYDGGMVRMDDVFAVEGVAGSFSKSGDSGAGVINDTGAVVGLLFAGTDAQTFAIPIQRILRRLKMRIV
jgi:S1-C subfamily serine protease